MALSANTTSTKRADLARYIRTGLQKVGSYRSTILGAIYEVWYDPSGDIIYTVVVHDDVPTQPTGA